MKFVVKHYEIIPGKAIREAVQKYGSKVLYVIDTIDSWSWYAIATALNKVGVPDRYADLIADFIVEYLM